MLVCLPCLPACREVSKATAAEASSGPSGRHGLHLVVMGHVDAGKSTLMGRLLHDLGQVSQKEVHKNQRESAQAGKVSWRLNSVCGPAPRPVVGCVFCVCLISPMGLLCAVQRDPSYFLLF